MIKDPLTWMKSMCKAHGFIFDSEPNSGRYRGSKCPTMLHNHSFTWYQHNRYSFQSMLHLWNDFYSHYMVLPKQDYVNDMYDFVMIRYEDLLFNPLPIIKKICKCLNVYSERMHHRIKIDNLNVSNLIIDRNASKRFFNSPNNLQAKMRCGNVTHRFSKWLESDIKYIRQNQHHHDPS